MTTRTHTAPSGIPRGRAAAAEAPGRDTTAGARAGTAYTKARDMSTHVRIERGGENIASTHVRCEVCVCVCVYCMSVRY